MYRFLAFLPLIVGVVLLMGIVGIASFQSPCDSFVLNLLVC